jgi:hypothetical protein
LPYVLTSQLGDNSFTLEIIGYEYPENTYDDQKANMLRIAVNVKTLNSSWSRTSPALLTWEVEDLIEWARGRYHLEPLNQFLRPSVQFYAVDLNEELTHFQITFDSDLLPPWHDSSSLIMELFVTSWELKKFAHELEADLAGFPYRRTDKAPD